MGDVEYGKIYDFYLPPGFLRLYDGPAVNVEDMWRILGKGTSNGGLICPYKSSHPNISLI